MEITAPGLQDTSEMLRLKPSQHAILLQSHFDDILNSTVHGVDVVKDIITATTVDLQGVSAEDSAHRLRRSLLDADIDAGMDLGLHKISSIRVLQPEGITQRTKRSCKTLESVLNKALEAQEFNFEAVKVRGYFNI